MQSLCERIETMSTAVKGYADPNALLPPSIQRFVDIAEECKPELHTTDELPLGLVRAVKDESHPLAWRVEEAGPVEDMAVLQPGDSIIVDFGESPGRTSFHGLKRDQADTEPASSASTCSRTSTQLILPMLHAASDSSLARSSPTWRRASSHIARG